MANNGAVGPVGVAADPNSPNDIYVTNYATGTLYRYDSTTGGIEGPAHQVSPLGLYGGNNATGLAFDKDGKLYVALQGSWAVAEISKANGSIIRYLDSTWGIFYCATGIATDPISGDLFVSSPCGWPILYVHPDGSGGGSVGPAVDGITFGPDGTLWGEGGGNVYKIDGSNKPTFGAFTAVASVAGGDGISVAAASDNPALPPYVFVNDNDGNITKVDLSGALPSYSAVTSGGSRGDFSTVAYNGCLYATQPDRVIKVTNADGTCSLAPVTPDDATALALTAPATDDFNDTITVSATLTNVSKSLPLAGQSVGFTLGSATCTAATTAAGIATGAAACSVVANQPSGATTISAAYVGDAYYVPAAASVAANMIASARAIKQGALDMLNGLVSPSGKKSDDDGQEDEDGHDGGHHDGGDN